MPMQPFTSLLQVSSRNSASRNLGKVGVFSGSYRGNEDTFQGGSIVTG